MEVVGVVVVLVVVRVLKIYVVKDSLLDKGVDDLFRIDVRRWD